MAAVKGRRPVCTCTASGSPRSPTPPHGSGLAPDDARRRCATAGLGTVPGTAARILDDDVRAVLSGGTDLPARDVGRAHHHRPPRRPALDATLVYGHVETPAQVVAHLRTLARIQDDTGGFTELIPMPFVPADSPVGLPTGARPGPSLRETRAVHAVARLLLAGRIDHVQAAWPKLGRGGARRVLRGGADDLGGLLLGGGLRPEAGAEAGRSLDPTDVVDLARELGRDLWQRTTTYEPVDHGLGADAAGLVAGARP